MCAFFRRWARDPVGIYLGRYDRGPKAKPGPELTYEGERHMLLFGPNGSGKFTNLLAQNLLRIRDRSMVVMDMKGELAATTALYRSSFSEVVILNPFNVLNMGGVGVNLLAGLDPDSPTFVDDAMAIGEAAIELKGNDPHWPESAQNLFNALVMWEVVLAKREGRERSLENVRRMMTEPEETAVGPDGRRRLVKGLRVTAARMCDQGGFEIASLVSRFLRDSDEIASIQSTADRQTTWMLSRPMRENMASNGVDFGDLRRRPMTVYVVLPPERMRTHSVWLRLVITAALRALYQPGGLRTLFVLDEFAALGYLAPIEDALAYMRGYGIQLWPILQDLTQLKSLYKDRWETFVANAGIVQGFAPNDMTTAEWMSLRSGETTVVAEGFNTGGQINEKGQSLSDGVSYQQTKRRLYLPQELMDLRAGAGVIWPAQTSKSIPFVAPPYWTDRELARRVAPNPYYEGSQTTARGGLGDLAAAVTGHYRAFRGGQSWTPR